MKTSLYDPEDYQMLKTALLARDHRIHWTFLSPYAKEAEVSDIYLNSFILWKTYATVGNDTASLWKVSYDEAGCIHIGFLNKLDNLPIEEHDDGVTVQKVRKMIKRLFTALEEFLKGQKIGGYAADTIGDMPLWPVCLENVNEFSYPLINLAKVIDSLIDSHDYAENVPYFKVDKNWIDAHPMTINKLKSLYDRISEKADLSGPASNQFVIEQRKMLLSKLGSIKNELRDLYCNDENLKNALKIENNGDPSFTPELLFQYDGLRLMRVFYELLAKRAFGDASEDASNEDRVIILEEFGLRDADDSEHSDGQEAKNAWSAWYEDMQKQCSTNSLYAVIDILLRYVSSEKWLETAEAAKLIAEDSGIPDARLYFHRLGLGF